MTPNNEAANDTGLRRHYWPPQSETDWTSVREQVRMGGTVWNEDPSPATQVLREQLAEEPVAPAPAPMRVLNSIDRALTWWIQLPDRIRNRIYVGITVAGVALFLLLLFTI